MPTIIKDLSLSAVVAGFLAVLVSYSGPLAIVFQAGNSAGIGPEMMTSWVWAISMGAAVSGIVLSLWLKAPVVTAWSAPGSTGSSRSSRCAASRPCASAWWGSAGAAPRPR